MRNVRFFMFLKDSLILVLQSKWHCLKNTIKYLNLESSRSHCMRFTDPKFTIWFFTLPQPVSFHLIDFLLLCASFLLMQRETLYSVFVITIDCIYASIALFIRGSWRYCLCSLVIILCHHPWYSLCIHLVHPNHIVDKYIILPFILCFDSFLLVIPMPI